MLKELTQEQKNQIEETIRSLSFDEKVGQMVCEEYVYIKEKNPADVNAWMKKYPIGSLYIGNEVIDTDNMTEAAIRKQVSDIQNVSRVPLVLLSDFEQGVGGQLDDAAYTWFPESMAIAATGDPKNAYEAGRITAEEAASLNVHWTLADVTDLVLNRDNPITGIRSYGDDPDRNIPFFTAHIRGLQEHNCAACAKHFPGDGIDTRNQHLVTSFNPLTKEEWMKSYGKVWKAAIDEGVMSIMVGHIAMPALEPIDPVTQKYRPATASKLIMTDLLRGELGFKGMITTDALGMNGFCSWADYDTRMLDAFNAGADVFEWPDTERFFDLMHRANAEGKISMERLDDAVRHVLEFKARLNLTAKPYCNPADKALADKMAADAVTLLRNTGNGIPLQRKDGAKYYVLSTPSHPRTLEVADPFIQALSAYGTVETALLEKMDSRKMADADAVFLINLGRMRYGDYRGMHPNIWPFMKDEKVRKRIVIGMANPFFLYDVPTCDAYIATWSIQPAGQKEAVKAIFGESVCRGTSPINIEGYVKRGQKIS